MRTAIFAKDRMTLTIHASEALELVQMGRDGRAERPIKLASGVNRVTVEAGVFKVISTAPVTVTADTAEIEVLSTLNNKDGWPPDRPKLPSGVDAKALLAFFSDARSTPAPR